MNSAAFILFFTIAFALYGGLNAYVFFHGWQILSRWEWVKWIYAFLFIAIALAFIAGRIGERFDGFYISSALVWIGSIWLGFLVYFFLSALVIDLAWLPLRWTGLSRYLSGDGIRLGVFSGVVLLTTVTVFLGYLNAKSPVTRRITLPLLASDDSRDRVRIAMASDIHLGTIISNSRVNRLVEMINGESPDLILFAGDLIDEDLKPVLDLNLGEALLRLRSKDGIFAVNGNHEFIGGAVAADRYLEEHGIRVLRDEWIRAAGLTIVGREDYSMVRFTGKDRLPLSEIMKDVDLASPVILLDHQPLHLEMALEAGVDLQLSGHTHRGQLWPFHLITSRVFEVDYGLRKIGNTYFYVSCGYGTWGPPVRTGNRPELVIIDLVKPGAK